MSTTDLRIQLDLRIPMRDGVELYAALYRPRHGERFPLLLIRSPYSTPRQRYVDWSVRFAAAGYAVVMQDCRGRYESEGKWRPYIDETDDGYDTYEWLGAQPWCDGHIGTFGVSYPGFTQILPAHLRSPYVKGLVPIANQEDNYGHMRCDGVLQLQNAMNFIWLGDRTNQDAPRDLIDWDEVYRRLPLVSALDDLGERPFYREIVRHSRFDEFWTSYSMKERYPEVETPAYFITGWYDNLLHEGFKCFRGFRTRGREPARRHTRLLVGPWTHTAIGDSAPFGDIGFGAEAAVDIPAEHLRWYDQRLRGIDTGIDDEPPVRIFVMGANRWRTGHEWPLAGTRCTPFYLRGSGRANSLFGDGRLSTRAPAEAEPPDTFTYDPEDPVPTWGGQSMFAENTGPRDRRPMQRRDDVLVYTSDPLEQDLEVTGPVELVLHAASDAPDTDFTATLVDVHPGGAAIHLCEGIVRARFRESFTEPSLLPPGRVHEYRISLWETSNLFRRGHRIRLEVSSSNFPRFDRNLNTGEDPADDDQPRPAAQTVYHDAARPSHLILPVMPA